MQKARPLRSIEIRISTHHLRGNAAGNESGHIGPSCAILQVTEIGVHKIARFHGYAPPALDVRLIRGGCLKVLNIRTQQLIYVGHEPALPGNPKNHTLRRYIFSNGRAIFRGELVNLVTRERLETILSLHLLLVRGYGRFRLAQHCPCWYLCQN
jgi:hypothetical protein